MKKGGFMELKMRNKLLWFFTIAFALVITSCGLLDSDSGTPGTEPIGGDPSTMGAPGNEFSLYASGLGVSDASATVTTQDNGVATLSVNGEVTDPMMQTMLDLCPTFDMVDDGSNTYTGSIKFRITTKGIHDIYEDGSPFTLIHYDADEGDSWKKDVNGRTITRKVTKVSKDDDYRYAFILIKVIAVEESGNGIPGVSKVVYYGNHKFGLVGMEIVFEDGSTKSATVFSDNINE